MVQRRRRSRLGTPRGGRAGESWKESRPAAAAPPRPKSPKKKKRRKLRKRCRKEAEFFEAPAIRPAGKTGRRLPARKGRERFEKGALRPARWARTERSGPQSPAVRARPAARRREARRGPRAFFDGVRRRPTKPARRSACAAREKGRRTGGSAHRSAPKAAVSFQRRLNTEPLSLKSVPASP